MIILYIISSISYINLFEEFRKPSTTQHVTCTITSFPFLFPKTHYLYTLFLSSMLRSKIIDVFGSIQIRFTSAKHIILLPVLFLNRILFDFLLLPKFIRDIFQLQRYIWSFYIIQLGLSQSYSFGRSQSLFMSLPIAIYRCKSVLSNIILFPYIMFRISLCA